MNKVGARTKCGCARAVRAVTAVAAAACLVSACAEWAGDDPAASGPEPRSTGTETAHDAAADLDEQSPAGTVGHCAPLPQIDGFAVRRASRIEVDGRAFRVGGTNLYYLQQLYAEGGMGNRVAESLASDALDSMVCLGLPVARVWAFNDSATSVSAIRSAPGVYHETGLRGLDRAVYEAKRRGIRLVMTLTNNWKEYGGLPAMARWVGMDKDDFFVEEDVRALWRQYASHLAKRVNVFTGLRYADEPAIMAWEIGNELRCQRCDDSQPLVDTVAALASFARGVFPRHLIADGGEGFDDDPALYPDLSSQYAVSGSTGSSFHRLARIPDLDMLSYHFYPHAWGLDSGYDAPIWIRRHEEIARAAGKVAYLGEYGLARKEGGLPDQVRAPVYDMWLEKLYTSSGGLLGFFWQLVPVGRANNDNHAVRVAGDVDTVAVVRKWVHLAR